MVRLTMIDSDIETQRFSTAVTACLLASLTQSEPPFQVITESFILFLRDST
jgi:hypothetical protein